MFDASGISAGPEIFDTRVVGREGENLTVELMAADADGIVVTDLVPSDFDVTVSPGGPTFASLAEAGSLDAGQDDATQEITGSIRLEVASVTSRLAADRRSIVISLVVKAVGGVTGAAATGLLQVRFDVGRVQDVLGNVAFATSDDAFSALYKTADGVDFGTFFIPGETRKFGFAEVVPGSRVSVITSVNSRGSVPGSGSFVARVVLSADADASADDTVLASAKVNLKPGRTLGRTVRLKYRAPEPVEGRRSFLLIEIINADGTPVDDALAGNDSFVIRPIEVVKFLTDLGKGTVVRPKPGVPFQARVRLTNVGNVPTRGRLEVLNESQELQPDGSVQFDAALITEGVFDTIEPGRTATIRIKFPALPQLPLFLVLQGYDESGRQVLRVPILTI